MRLEEISNEHAMQLVEGSGISPEVIFNFIEEKSEEGIKKIYEQTEAIKS